MGNGTGSVAKDAFGPGLGLGHEFGLAMSDEQVTPSMFKQAVSMQGRKQSVGAALRGELQLTTITPADWVAREMAIGAELVKCGLPGFDQKLVEMTATDDVGLYDRFVSAGFQRRQLLEACGKAGVKLYQGNARDADRDGDEMPTVASVFTLDYMNIFRPTNPEHHPFMLDYDQQWSWATERGGEGFSTAEEFLYVGVLRPRIELGCLPYMGGSVRCQNACGSDRSLYVFFRAGSGLSVYFWARSDEDWDLWALPRKFRELGS